MSLFTSKTFSGNLKYLWESKWSLSITMFNPGFFSKQYCCYYCRAVQWVYEGDNPELNNYLYTSFGPTAKHRNTTLVVWALERHFCFHGLLFFMFRFRTNHPHKRSLFLRLPLQAGDFQWMGFSESTDSFDEHPWLVPMEILGGVRKFML